MVQSCSLCLFKRGLIWGGMSVRLEDALQLDMERVFSAILANQYREKSIPEASCSLSESMSPPS